MMRLAIPGPGDVFRLATQLQDTAQQLVGVVPRLVGIVAEVEHILERVHGVITAIDRLEDRAGVAVGEVEAIVRRVDPLLARFEPVLDQVEPIAKRIMETTAPDEVEAVVTLVNHLPELVAKIDRDILPIMDTLGSVAPDLRDLLVTSRELNEIVASIPGMGRMRKRVEAQMAHDEHQPDPVHPARQNDGHRR